MRGPGEFKTFWHALRATAKDFDITVEDAFETGEQVVARLVSRFTHTRCEQRLSMEGICMFRVRDGQIVEARQCWDFLGVLTQLGAVEVETAASLLGGKLP